jgi:uracil phosphoribosyltransferase
LDHRRRGRRALTFAEVTFPAGAQAEPVVGPDATVYTVAIDRELNARKFIRPDLGDFGNRLVGT